MDPKAQSPRLTLRTGIFVYRDQRRPRAIVHSVTGSCNTVTKSFQVSQGENKIKFIMKRGCSLSLRNAV